MPNWRQVGTLWAYVQLEMSPKVDAVYFQGLARRFVRGSREISLVPSVYRRSDKWKNHFFKMKGMA